MQRAELDRPVRELEILERPPEVARREPEQRARLRVRARRAFPSRSSTSWATRRALERGLAQSAHVGRVGVRRPLAGHVAALAGCRRGALAKTRRLRSSGANRLAA